MAQTTDYNLANQSGADFRAELNEILAASVSLNSGASEPSTMYAHQLWVDTSSNVLKIRNAANNAWLTTGVSITASNTFDINAGTINGITSLSFSSGATVASILDEDNLSSDSATALATQQSIKAYVDSQVTAQDLDITDGTNTISIDLDSESLSLLGGTGITSTASGNGVTFSADLTSVVAGDGLTGGGASGDVTLAVGVDDSSIEINSDALRVKASGITNTMLSGSIANNKLSNSSVTINAQSLSLGGSVTLNTDVINEGSSNLYYTDARANSAIDTRVTNTFINNLSGVVADTATALATARTIALSGDVVGSVSFDGTSDVTISSAIQANSVALGTDTVGNYVATITGTANKVSVSGSGSETAGVTLSLPDDVQIADSLTVAGNLTVNGTLTSLDTTNLDIEDNLFQLNAGLTGSPVNDSGMLINRGNQNNGIFMWDESADKFTMGLTTADGSSTGNITLASLGTLVANLEGNVTGNVTGQVSDISNFTTANLTENTNLYYTDARSRGAISASGDISYNSSTGVISFSQSASPVTSVNTQTGAVVLTTANISENTNLYYTDARVQAVSINNVVEDTTPQLGGNLDLNSSDITGAGDISITGAITASGNITGTLATAAQPNITSVGSLTALDVTGTATMDGLTVDTSTLVVDSTNNRVGIGTTSPSELLHINRTSNTGAYIRIQDASGSNYIGTDGGVFQVLNGSASELMRIDGSDNATFAGTISAGSITSSGTAQATRLGLGVAPHSTAGLNITSTNQNIRLNNGSELAVIDLDANGGLKFWSHGDGSNNEILFYQGSGSGSEVMRLDGSGRVGISTSSPNANLHVGSASATGDTTNPALQIGGASTYRLGMYTSAEGAVIENKNGDDGIQFRVKTAGEAMRIDTTGVGIGCTPSRELELAAANPRFRITDTDGGYSEISGNSGHLGFSADAGNSQGGTRITFDIDGSEKARIDSSGRTYIGTTSTTPAFGTGTGICFNVGDATHISAPAETIFNRTASEGTLISCRKGGTQVGSISVTASATAYNTSSDARLKDVTGEARGLEVINKLNPVAYNWKADGNADEGLIAQEVLDIVPNAVSGSEEDMYQMDYSKLVVHLVKAVQELKAEIDELKGE